MTAAVGVDLNDIEAAFGEEFALALGGDDAGIGQLVGGVAGAAMGGAGTGFDPTKLASAGSVTLAFENDGKQTSETMDRLVGAVAGLVGGGGQQQLRDVGRLRDEDAWRCRA